MNVAEITPEVKAAFKAECIVDWEGFEFFINKNWGMTKKQALGIFGNTLSDGELLSIASDAYEAACRNYKQSKSKLESVYFRHLTKFFYMHKKKSDGVVDAGKTPYAPKNEKTADILDFIADPDSDSDSKKTGVCMLTGQEEQAKLHVHDNSLRNAPDRVRQALQIFDSGKDTVGKLKALYECESDRLLEIKLKKDLTEAAASGQHLYKSVCQNGSLKMVLVMAQDRQHAAEQVAGYGDLLELKEFDPKKFRITPLSPKKKVQQISLN